MSDGGSSKIVQFDADSDLGNGSGTVVSELSVLTPSPKFVGPESGLGKSPAQIYFNRHRIMECLEEAVHDLALKLPDDPYAHLSSFFHSKSSPASTAPVSVSEKKPLMRIVSTSVISVDTLVIPGAPSRSDAVENKAPEVDIDSRFVSYLTDLASSVRRGTT